MMKLNPAMIAFKQGEMILLSLKMNQKLNKYKAIRAPKKKELVLNLEEMESILDW